MRGDRVVVYLAGAIGALFAAIMDALLGPIGVVVLVAVYLAAAAYHLLRE